MAGLAFHQVVLKFNMWLTIRGKAEGEKERGGIGGTMRVGVRPIGRRTETETRIRLD